MSSKRSTGNLQQDIVQVLAAHGKLRTRDLYNRLRRPVPYHDFKQLLARLLEQQLISRAAKRTWSLPQPEKTPAHHPGAAGPIITGVLQFNGSGSAFVLPEQGVERIFIRKPDRRSAIQGDTVRVRLMRTLAGGRKEGVVINILNRGMQQLVGRVERRGRHLVLVPDGVSMPGTVLIRHSQITLAEGMPVLARLIPGDGGIRQMEVDIIRSYSESSRADLLQATIRSNWLLEADFSDAVLDEVEQLADSVDAADRRDLRDWIIFTIDPDDARDFDDAVSLEPLPDGGFRLGVHIADVSHYVQAGTELDREACRRGLSTYLVGEVIPMLPHRLSSDLCSLKENEERHAFSCLIDFDRHGKRLRYELFPSVIRSRRRFNYRQVQELLQKMPLFQEGLNPETEFPDPVMRSLRLMNLLYRKLRGRRQEGGSLDFSTSEPVFELDREGMPIEVSAQQQLDSHRLIEEFMLAANRVVAEHLQKAGVPAIYRVHDAPVGEKLQRFTEYMRHLGRTLDPAELTVVTTWQQLLQEFQGTDRELVLQEVVLRSMMKAGYTTRNRGHFGLSFASYTHFTSPIRRYPDLVIHRILKKLAVGDSLPVEQLTKAARTASQREIDAMEAERESILVKQLLYLEGQIGERFRGVIRGVERFGLFVELTDILADGLVPVGALTDDYYVYDARDWTLTGRHTGTRYAIGQSLLVEVTWCSVEERKLDLKIVESLEAID